MSLTTAEVERLERIANRRTVEHFDCPPGHRRAPSIQGQGLLAMNALYRTTCELCHRGTPATARQILGRFRGLCADCIAELDGKQSRTVERRSSSFSPQQRLELLAMLRQRYYRERVSEARRRLGIGPMTARQKLNAGIAAAYR